MFIKQLNEEGVEVEFEVFTSEELETKALEKAKAIEEDYKKQLEEKDNHLKTKLDEFQQAKKKVEGKEGEISEKEELLNQQIEEIKKIAEEANSKVEQSEKEKIESIKKVISNQLVGNDAEMTKKLEDAYNLINMEAKTTEEIQQRTFLAAKMIGIQTENNIPTVSFGGGAMAPNFTPTEKKQSEEGYKNFISELGLPDVTSKK